MSYAFIVWKVMDSCKAMYIARTCSWKGRGNFNMVPITAVSCPLVTLNIFILRHPRELDAIILFFSGKEMGKMLSSSPPVTPEVLWHFMDLNQHPWGSGWAVCSSRGRRTRLNALSCNHPCLKMMATFCCLRGRPHPPVGMHKIN